MNTGEHLRSIPTEHTDQLEALAVSADGNTILTGSWDGTICVWDLETGTYLSTFATGHIKGGRALQFTGDGKILISWTGKDEKRFWDTVTGAQISNSEFQASEKQSPNASNRTTFAEIDKDRKIIHVRDVATGREMHRITGHKDKIWAFVYSPDWKTLASGSEDMTIRLWDAITGNEILTLPTYTNTVFAVAFSPDGKILAGGSVYDSQLGRSDLIRLWELPSGQVLTTLAGHTSTVRTLRFSPDGKTLASSGDDGTILLWDMDKIVRLDR